MSDDKGHRVCPPYGPCPFCHHEEGQQEERAAVVVWLRDHARLSFEGVVHIDAERMALANAIERGEHVRPPPVAAEEG